MNEKAATGDGGRPPVLGKDLPGHVWSYDFPNDRLDMTFRTSGGALHEIDAGEGLRLRFDSNGSWLGLSLDGVQRHVKSLSAGQVHVAPPDPDALEVLVQEIGRAESKRAQTRAIIRMALCGIGLQAV